MYPTHEEIIALHKKYSPGDKAFQTIFTHCQIVQEIALQLIQKKSLEVNLELVKAGTLLHDIGTYQFVDAEGNFGGEYIQHGIKGYEMLKEEGLPEELCNIAKNHTGVGITAQEISEKNIPLPHQDFIAETIEEKLVMYADKFHSKAPDEFNSFDSYRAYVGRFGEEKQKKFDEFAELFGKPELEELAKKYNQPIR